MLGDSASSGRSDEWCAIVFRCRTGEEAAGNTFSIARGVSEQRSIDLAVERQCQVSDTLTL